MGDSIGAATGVKMCFAATTKGLVSLDIQSFTVAHQVDALPVLQASLERQNPPTLTLAGEGLTTMPPKAPHWAHETSEIRKVMEEDRNLQHDLFYGLGEVYRAVAEDSKLGQEKPVKRDRGKTVEVVVELLSEGLQAKRKRTES